MPRSRSPGSVSTSCASSRAGAPGVMPVRCPPGSTSTTTSATTPASAAASERSRALAAVSTAWMKPPHHFFRYMARRILRGVTFTVVIRICSTPCSNITSASEIFAVQMPTDPVAICNRAMAGHLWVLAWGRLAMPLRETVVCMRSRLPSSRSRSTQRHGVSRSHLEMPASSAAAERLLPHLGRAVALDRLGNPHRRRAGAGRVQEMTTRQGMGHRYAPLSRR